MIGQDTTQYGFIPRTLRFAILYALNSIKTIENDIPDLPLPILENLLSSIRIAKIKKYEALKEENKPKTSQKV